MSNHLAVATVTATLGQLALSAAESAVDGNIKLHFGRPVNTDSADEKLKLHVYLYQVTPNSALRNSDLPTRDADGKLSRRPRAALDLHYLLSFYGDEDKLEPDRMLGAVVRDLHAHPVPALADIKNAIASHGLVGSDLASATETVKFTPAQLSLDDLSRLWSIMVQTPHVVSVPYVATVVLIDALDGAPAALPVLKRGKDDRGVDTRIGPFPQLRDYWAGAVASAETRSRLPSYPAAQLGVRLLFSGANLGGDTVTLRFSHPRIALAQEIVVTAADRDATELRCTLPDDAPAQTRWAAGVYAVTAKTKRGDTDQMSSVLPIVLSPRISALQPNNVPAGAGTSIVFNVTCRPQVLREQSAVLLLGNREVTADARPNATDTLKFTVTNAPKLANELVRVRIDGIDSFPFGYDVAAGAFIFDDAQRIIIT